MAPVADQPPPEVSRPCSRVQLECVSLCPRPGCGKLHSYGIVKGLTEFDGHEKSSKDMVFHQSHSLQNAGCLRACKIFGRDLTKMFHVKHFGKVLSPNRTNP